MRPADPGGQFTTRSQFDLASVGGPGANSQLVRNWIWPILGPRGPARGPTAECGRYRPIRTHTSHTVYSWACADVQGKPTPRSRVELGNFTRGFLELFGRVFRGSFAEICGDLRRLGPVTACDLLGWARGFVNGCGICNLLVSPL